MIPRPACLTAIAIVLLLAPVFGQASAGEPQETPDGLWTFSWNSTEIEGEAAVRILFITNEPTRCQLSTLVRVLEDPMKGPALWLLIEGPGKSGGGSVGAGDHRSHVHVSGLHDTRVIHHEPEPRAYGASLFGHLETEPIKMTVLADRLHPVADGDTTLPSISVTLQCEAPFQILHKAGSTQASLFSEQDIEGGAGANTWERGFQEPVPTTAVNVLDGVDRVFDTEWVEAHLSGWDAQGSSAGYAHLSAPETAELWELREKDGSYNHRYEGPPGPYDLDIIRGSHGWNIFTGAVFGLTTVADLDEIAG